MSVLRHKRIVPSAEGTSIASLRMPFTVKSEPLSAFSGRPPSCGPKRGSRQVPVQMPGSGSIFASASVSL